MSPICGKHFPWFFQWGRPSAQCHLVFPKFGHLLVGRALGLRRAPRPAFRRFNNIRRVRLGAAPAPAMLSDVGLVARREEPGGCGEVDVGDQ